MAGQEDRVIGRSSSTRQPGLPAAALTHLYQLWDPWIHPFSATALSHEAPGPP